MKNSLYWSLVIPLFYLFIHFGIDNYPMWAQYTLMDRHRVTNTGILWVLHLQPHRFQGFQVDYFHSKTIVLCVIVQMIAGGGMTLILYLG